MTLTHELSVIDNIRGAKGGAGGFGAGPLLKDCVVLIPWVENISSALSHETGGRFGYHMNVQQRYSYCRPCLHPVQRVAVVLG